MRGANARYVVADEAAFTDDYADPVGNFAADSCPTCGAEMDDGECEECERVAPLDFDQ